MRTDGELKGVVLTVYTGTVRGRQMDSREIKLVCNSAQERPNDNSSNGFETERDAIKWSLW